MPSTSDPEVLIVRDVAAPRELVFAMWASREHLEAWFAPPQCRLIVHSLDFRAGGALRTSIILPDGKDCRCLSTYRDIVAPERIVFTMASVDAEDRPLDPKAIGMDPAWPQATTVTVTFADLRAGRTRMTLHQTVGEALAKRTGAHPSWLLMFDRLDRALAHR